MYIYRYIFNVYYRLYYLWLSKECATQYLLPKISKEINKKILIPTGLKSTELDFEVAGDPYKILRNSHCMLNFV